MNKKSVAAQHRIAAAFPHMHKWADYKLVLSVLVAFFEGDKILLNNGWSHSRGHASLLSNSEGRHALKVLQAVGVRVVFGNNAPRGGAAGDYFQCFRRSAGAAAYFRQLLADAVAGK